MANLSAPILGGSGKVDLDPAVFGEAFNGSLVHEVVRAEQAAKRQGTASTKRRGEVSMTGAKAWRQKGTGRARVGALSAGHRRGGGVTFGPKPRNYVIKVNRKARRKALRAALSLHAENGTIAILEGSNYSEPSTKTAATSLANWQDSGSVVVLTAGENERDVALSFRNIRRVRAVQTPQQIGVSEIAAAKCLVISKEALEALSALAKTDLDRSSKQEFVAATRFRPLNGKALAATGGSNSSSATSASSDAHAASESDGAPTEGGDGSDSGDVPNGNEGGAE